MADPKVSGNLEEPRHAPETPTFMPSPLRPGVLVIGADITIFHVQRSTIIYEYAVIPVGIPPELDVRVVDVQGSVNIDAGVHYVALVLYGIYRSGINGYVAGYVRPSGLDAIATGILRPNHGESSCQHQCNKQYSDPFISHMPHLCDYLSGDSPKGNWNASRSVRSINVFGYLFFHGPNDYLDDMIGSSDTYILIFRWAPPKPPRPLLYVST